MFSLSSITTTFASTQKKFKKFGKKLRKQRDGEVDGIKDKIKEIAKDEIERTKSLFEKHKDFFKDNKTSVTPASETTAIDFYEKP
jgi:hypothetical protein